MVSFIPSLKPENPVFAFAKVAQLAASPNIELIFAATQEAVQKRMDADIEKIKNGGEQTAGETALLYRKLAAIEPRLAEWEPYSTRTTNNVALIKQALTELDDLSSLAAPATLAEFTAQRAQVRDTIDRLRTADPAPVGIITDHLNTTKAETLAALDALVTNDFVTQADIDAVQDALALLTTELTTRLDLVTLNKEIAANTIESLKSIQSSTQDQIDAIEIDAASALNKKVEDAQSYYARILTNFSVGLDSALNASTTLTSPLFNEPAPTGTLFDYMA